MAKHRNSLKIEGFLVDEPKTFPMGKSRKVVFNLEVQDEYNDKTTKQYFKVEGLGKSVDQFMNHSPGDHVQLEGQIAQSNYTKKDGTKVNETYIKALSYGWKKFVPRNQDEEEAF